MQTVIFSLGRVIPQSTADCVRQCSGIIIFCMANDQRFRQGDVLIFQIESGFGLLRVLDIEDGDIWHLTVYRDLFQDVEMADAVAAEPANLTAEYSHIALTGRAFESTQVSKLRHVDLREEELVEYKKWRSSNERLISDRSVRLHLGFR